MKGPAACCLLVLLGLPAAGLEPHLVKDVNPVPSPGGSGPAAFTALGGVAVFEASEGSDRVLWRSDGTPEGTRLAVDLGSAPSQVNRDRIWFVRGRSLWQSDGTPAGTVLVRKLPGKPRILGGVGRHLVLAAGNELWSTDGILARGLGVLDSVVQGGRLWFVAETKRGQELWISDGVSARQVTAFSRKRAFFDPVSSMYLNLPRSGGQFVFAVHDGIHGPEPWVSDGTFEGTRLLRDLCPGPCAGIEALGLAHGGRTYFTGNDDILGRELWSTDGNRVDLVRDVCPGPCDSDPGSLVVMGDRPELQPVGQWELLAAGPRVFFLAFDPGTGVELWAVE